MKSTKQKKLSPLGEERNALIQSLDDTKQELDIAYLGFNQTTDPDLIDFYLYEIDALRARYGYLLRRIKVIDLPNGPATLPTEIVPQVPPN